MGSFERLSAQDSSFVMFDDGRGHLSVAAVAVFGPGDVVDSAGRLDVERIRQYVGSRLHLLPRYRQRLGATPLQRHPIWVDDPGFDIAHHVRHAALPRPGTRAQLKELAGRLVSQPLDVRRPLWELWCVEGLEGGGFAMVAKVHHCLVDGVSGVGVVSVLLSPSAEPGFEPAREWTPRPEPGLLDFLGDGAARGGSLVTDTVRNVSGALLSPVETAGSLLDTAAAGLDTLRAGLRPPPDTPLNVPIGSQRRLEWVDFSLPEIRDLRKRLDGSVNDVVLTLVSGALRRFLRQRQVPLRGLELRVIVPVDTRAGPVDLSVGNKVSAWFLSLPVGESAPLRRYDRIRSQTRQLRRSKAERGVDAFLRFSDWSGISRLPYWGVSVVNALRPYNLIVTNIHGPQVPLYLLGAPLERFYPSVPLFESQALSVAVLSYRGQVSFGLLGDWDRVPDLEAVGASLHESFDELSTVAERPDRPRRRRPRRPTRRPLSAAPRAHPG